MRRPLSRIPNPNSRIPAKISHPRQCPQPGRCSHEALVDPR
ncbi:hypothetical protein [Lysobacter gummosus]